MCKPLAVSPRRASEQARLGQRRRCRTASGGRRNDSLAAALLIGGQYSRAAQLFEQAGTAYQQYLGATDPWALDCAYQAGHAYAEAMKPDKALPQLRYYVLNAAPLAKRDADEATKVMHSRFFIAQLLASTGEMESAIAELQAVRPLLAAAYGPDSAQVRNLDKQAARLQSAART